MELSLPTKSQIVSIAKAAVYVSVSAGLDFLIHETTGTQFGQLTPLINVALVTLKKLLTKENK